MSHLPDDGVTVERDAPGWASRLLTRGHVALSERFAQLIASKTRLEIHVREEVWPDGLQILIDRLLPTAG